MDQLASDGFLLFLDNEFFPDFNSVRSWCGPANHRRVSTFF
jgi:hypothetical protein